MRKNKITHFSLVLILSLVAFFAQAQPGDTAYRKQQPFVGLPVTVKAAIRRFKLDRTQFEDYIQKFEVARITNGQKYPQNSDDQGVLCLTAPIRPEVPISTPNEVNQSFLYYSSEGSYLASKYIPYVALSSNHLTKIDDQAHTYRPSYPVTSYDERYSHNSEATFNGYEVTDPNGSLQMTNPLLLDGKGYTHNLGSKNPHERAGFIVPIQVTPEIETLNLDYGCLFTKANYSNPLFKPYLKFRIRDKDGNVLNDPQNFVETENQNWRYLKLDLHNYVGQLIYLQFEAGDSPHASNVAGQALANVVLYSPFKRVSKVCIDTKNSFGIFLFPDPISDYGFSTTPALVLPNNLSFSEEDITANYSYKFTEVGDYDITKVYTKPNNRDLVLNARIIVKENLVNCDKTISTPTDGCVGAAVPLQFVAGTYYSLDDYYFKWEFPSDGKRFFKGNDEYIEFCSIGEKEYHLKIYRHSDKGLERDVSRTLTITDCKNFYGALEIPDSACAGETVPYFQEFASKADPKFHTVTWTFEGDHSLSSDQNGQYVAFDFIGARTITLNITGINSGCVSTSTKNIFVKDCKGIFNCCPTAFAPKQGSYVFSGWVNFDPSLIEGKQPYFQLTVNYQTKAKAIFKIKPNVEKSIDGWYQATGTIPISAYGLDIDLQMINPSNSDAYFDDIRMQPINSSQKGFVYDNYTKRLIAEMDENNYGTFYEYDEEGNLIRVKKETERGIMMIKESNQNLTKPTP